MRYPKIRNSEPVQGWINSEESRDAYLNEEDPQTDPARCPSCDNIYYKKTWHHPDELDDRAELGRPFEELPTSVCPGCQKVEDEYFYGELKIVSTPFLKEHHREIANLINNAVDRAQVKNPLSKLVEVGVEGDEAHFATTNGKLAERIGRELKKAYQGELEITKTEPYVQVEWRR